MSKDAAKDEQYSEREAARRRDTVLKRMLETPPRPFTPKAKKRRKSATARPKRAK